MTYEAWRCTFQSSEQAARTAYKMVTQQAERIRELEKKRDEYKLILDTVSTDNEKAQAERIATLEAENERLRKDSEQLCYLIASEAIVIQDDDGYYLYWYTSMRSGPTKGTAREAIDSAMQKEKQNAK